MHAAIMFATLRTIVVASTQDLPAPNPPEFTHSDQIAGYAFQGGRGLDRFLPLPAFGLLSDASGRSARSARVAPTRRVAGHNTVALTEILAA
jgi:hypothetical protein